MYFLFFIFLFIKYTGVDNLLSEGVKAPSVLNGGLDNFYVLLGKYVRYLLLPHYFTA